MSAGDQSEAIIVIDSELAQNHDVYEAGFRRMGGTYIPVDRLTRPRVRGSIDSALKDIAKEVLLRIGISITITQDGDDVLVQRADGIDPLNPSEQSVLKFVAALFSEDLAANPVGAISWSETGLDELVQEAIWKLARSCAGGRGIGALLMPVFIAGGTVRPGVHCEHESSVRYALTDRGLLKRKRLISLSTAVGKLVRYPERLLVLFLGAGASASANMPLGNEVRDYALGSFFNAAAATPVNVLGRRFRDWVVEHDRLLAGEEDLDAGLFAERLTLERVLREEFRRDTRDESLTLQYLLSKNSDALQFKRTRLRVALRAIFSKPHKIVLVTVNFDTILEDEFGDGLEVFALADSFARAPEYMEEYVREGGRIPLLKLHGTLAAVESIVADVETRSLGLPAGAAEALQLLRGEPGHPTPWVYVGTSMRDPDVTEIIQTPDFAEHLDEWWVSPFPDPGVSLFVDPHRHSRWRRAGRSALGERQITETADTFLSTLASQWPLV